MLRTPPANMRAVMHETSSDRLARDEAHRDAPVRSEGAIVDIGGYLLIARRWWWTLLVATAVSALIAYLVASRIPPTYEAGAQLLVGPINTDVDTLRASSQLDRAWA